MGTEPPAPSADPRTPVVVDARGLDAAIIADAAARIRAGHLVAFPTETVYGLGANALDAEAVARIFAAKGRPSYNPVIAHVADVAGARALVTDWPESAARLAERFWPGPLTLVLPARDVVPSIVRARLPSVGVRVPDHPVALALLRAAARPIAAPSANRFTEISPTTAEHVARGLGSRVPLILDGGPTTVGIESTVLDLSTAVPTILRPGSITTAMLTEALGRDVATAESMRGDAPRPAPGMIERHYAPRADVWLFDATDVGDVVAALAERQTRQVPGVVGAIWRRPHAIPEVTRVMRLPDDPIGYARDFYAALHELDAEGTALILLERPPELPEWAGVRDRVERAAR
ncbi:MAG: L-threonylcarbamoyladenylate synthase [Gemmatimonadaceae bacterium]|jgi:L-threonylcarbamoyladenylate synthase|nr:L-threonylcarbamoyladenylate synthase [Gemmatimonadaceae bacterium]